MRKSWMAKIFTIFFCTIVLGIFVPGQAKAQVEDFEIKDGVLVRYNGNDSDVTIPEGVTEIGNLAFCMTGVENVIIPDGVKRIGGGAFVTVAS